MARVLAGLRSHRLAWGGAALAAIVVVAALVLGRDGGEGAKAAEQSAQVQRGPFVIAASFSGQIVPGERLDLTAPFDGRVAALAFAYGDQVEAGQVLVQFDPADFVRGRAEAEIALLKAQAEAERLSDWERSPDMRRATRALDMAQSDLDDLKVQAGQTRGLLDRGLVARSEYDSLGQQLRQREAAVAAAREDLAATTRRGRGEERRIALLQREVARAGYSGDARPTLRAPGAGVVVRPDDEEQGGEGGVHAGGQVRKGQLLAVIASAAGLDVAFKLDEADLAGVEVGRKAVVTGPGFSGALNGRVARVSGEAKAPPGAGKAMFEVRVRLDPLTPDAARRVRIGMSANVAMPTYENASALTVPPQAVQGAAPAAYVMVRARPGRPAERRPIVVGQVGPAAVEVLSGLRAGETVVWSATPPPVAVGASPSPGL